MMTHIGLDSIPDFGRHFHFPQVNYDEAEQLYRRAVAIAEATLDTDHPDFSTRLRNLADLFEQQVGSELR